MKVDFNKLSVRDSQHYLQHAIAPRPICFASTMDSNGNVNLSPFSFFNVFSSCPPIVVFSPSRRARNNTTKDTYENILQVPEVSINIVDYEMVQQMSLSSCEYPSGVNEFVKSGFTMEPSSIIKPPLVAESKIKMECRINEIKPLGDQGGAGILVIAEVLVMHIADEILDEKAYIDPLKIRQVARLGGDWYIDARPEHLFTLPKPVLELGIGVDGLPPTIVKESTVLTGNHLGALANIAAVPEVREEFDDPILQLPQVDRAAYDRRIAELLDAGDLEAAWQLVLRIDQVFSLPNVITG